MNLRTRAIRGLLWAAVQQWATQIISFVSLLVLARLLGPEAFGLIAIVTVFLVLIQTVANQGFSLAIIQRKELESKHLHTAFWTSTTLSVVAAMVFSSLAQWLADLYQQPKLEPLVLWLAVIPIVTATSALQAAILKRNIRFKAIVVPSLIGTGAGALTAVIMAICGHGLWALVGQQYVSALITGILIWRVSDFRPKLQFSTRHLRQLWSFGSHVLAFNLLSVVNRRLDVLLIGYFLHPTALGYFSVGKRATATLSEALTGAVNQVALPTLAKIQDDDERLCRVFFLVTRSITLVTFPAFALLALLSSEIVVVVLGNDWAASAPVVSWLAIGALSGSAMTLADNTMLAKGRSGTRLLIAVIGTTLGAIAILATYPYGIGTVALALVARQLLMAPVRYLVLKRLIGLDWRVYLRCLVAPARATVGLAVAVLGVKAVAGSAGPAIVMLAGIGSGLAVYLSVLAVFDGTLLRRLLKSAKTDLKLSAMTSGKVAVDRVERKEGR